MVGILFAESNSKCLDTIHPIRDALRSESMCLAIFHPIRNVF